MSLGDIKPESLRLLESLIWKHLLQVVRCEISPADMVNIILDTVVPPAVLSGFCLNQVALRDHFDEKFDATRDHTDFFHPGIFLPWI